MLTSALVCTPVESVFERLWKNQSDDVTFEWRMYFVMYG
jgi:hypothetical protein